MLGVLSLLTIGVCDVGTRAVTCGFMVTFFLKIKINFYVVFVFKLKIKLFNLQF